jgi:tetratricopeptide (TPR) repeat protein
MARVELANYPANEWDDGRNITAYAPAEAHFRRALLLNDANRTAWHRLGLIALQRRDFETAVRSLRNANILDRNHRGIHKTLGYAYLWAGQIDEAISLLAYTPEAASELDVYTWWWGTKGRDDLSQLAGHASRQLAAIGTSCNIPHDTCNPYTQP